MPRAPAPPMSPPDSDPHFSQYTIANSVAEMPSTPAPIRARINVQQNQINELVRSRQGLERKHRLEVGGLMEEVERLKRELREAGGWKRKAEEMERMRAEGEEMREELNLHSLVQQQKALLAVVTEQMGEIDLEHQNLKLQSERVMRDYKITLFESREADLNAEIAEREEEVAERDAQLVDLEAALVEANTSLVHQKAAETKASKEEARMMASKIASLEKELHAAQKQERLARDELQTMLNQEQSRGGTVEQEKVELKKALREIKSDLARKTEELSDLQEEFGVLKEASQEREKTLRAKVKEAMAERDRLVGIEEELESLKRSAKTRTATPVEAPKKVSKTAKARKQADSDSEDEVIPSKKSRKADISRVERSEKDKSGKTLKEVSTNDPARLAPPSSTTMPTLKVTDADAPEQVVEPEKKKKRKLFGATPTFSWDPIMNSGDGVIPMTLSPVKPTEKSSTGTIPRKGFGSLASSRSLSKLV